MRVSSLFLPAVLVAALFALICSFTPCFAGAPAPMAASVTVVYAFSAQSLNKTNADGATPTSLTLEPNGDLIGTARAGGPHGTGTVFQVTPAGDFTTLYSFSALRGAANANTDGAVPLAALTRGADGRYYGVASAGGAEGEGTIFALDTSGKLTTLYSFSGIAGIVNGNSNGAQPSAPLIEAGDELYGAATTGGDGGQGTIFTISPAGQFKRLYSFGLSTDMETNSDGGQPLGGLVPEPDGSFYGVSAAFGSGGAGTIYRITADGQFTVIHAFLQLDDNRESPDGAAPSAGMVLAPDGFFYGTTLLGGRYGTGTIFRIDPAGGHFEILHTFSALKSHHLTNLDGANPQGSLLMASDGNLYGTTRDGGASGTGSIFRIAPDGDFETLYTFSGLDKKGINPDGANPCGPLVEGKNGTLYGTATAGGLHGTGTIFEFTLAAGAAR